jgi:hypothetical protein
MTARRATAYTNVIRALEDVSCSIATDDQAAIREAADVRLFASEAGSEPDHALRSAEALLDRLADQGRISPWVADQIAYELAACGPYAPPVGARR